MHVSGPLRCLNGIHGTKTVAAHTQDAMLIEADLCFVSVDIGHGAVFDTPTAAGAALVGEEGLEQPLGIAVHSPTLQHPQQPSAPTHPLYVTGTGVNHPRQPLYLALRALQSAGDAKVRRDR